MLKEECSRARYELFEHSFNTVQYKKASAKEKTRAENEKKRVAAEDATLAEKLQIAVSSIDDQELEQELPPTEQIEEKVQEAEENNA